MKPAQLGNMGWALRVQHGIGILYDIALGVIPEPFQAIELLEEDVDDPVYSYHENGQRLWHCDGTGYIHHECLMEV